MTTEAVSRAPAGEAGFRFRVTTAPGQGTVVEAELPLTDPAEALGT